MKRRIRRLVIRWLAHSTRAVGMSDSELLSAFGMGPKHPLIRAHAAIAAQVREDMVQELQRTDLSAHQVDMARGAIRAIDDMTAEVEAQLERAIKVDEAA